LDKARFLVETHLLTGRPIGGLAAAHGVSRSWLYKVLARYRAEGPAGLEPRSRRPHSTPTRIVERYEDAIVELRKQLTDAGFDAGAVTIHYHLSQQRDDVPSVSTIWRVLKARGFVTPQPRKRPRSSWIHFEADLPNECWQADVTHVRAADGSFFEVLNIVDDHSRLCVESRAFVTTRSADVVRALHRAAAKWGYPEALLTDNGGIFTASPLHAQQGAIEPELLSLGIRTKHGRPYHPQTQGKVERFHQTLKRHLAKQALPATKKQLQGQLDRFVAYYNHHRPHRELPRRRPPFNAFQARERAYPTGPIIDCTGYRIRHDRIGTNGTVTIRHHGRLHHIAIGSPYRRWRVIMLIAGLEIRILDLDGNQLRRLQLDPNRDYQPIGSI
jgi:transposase InsO family protein